MASQAYSMVTRMTRVQAIRERMPKMLSWVGLVMAIDDGAGVYGAGADIAKDKSHRLDNPSQERFHLFVHCLVSLR